MMKRILCLLAAVSICCLCTVSFADYTPSMAGDKNTREYKYEGDPDFPDLVLQEGDLDEAVLCQTIREIIKEQIDTDNEVIEEISIDKDAILKIVISWNPGFTDGWSDVYMAQTRFSGITDSILRYPEIDQFWNKILFVYPGGEGLFSKDMIVDSEYGRYFNAVETIIK